MRVAAYARVSTADKDQDPETQLMALRDFCSARGWTVVREYVDHGVSGRDLVRRKQWRTLQDDAARRRFQAIVVFKLDRAFRSVKDLHDHLAAWDMIGVSFVCVRDSFDTSTPAGRLLMNMLAAVAEFELDLISERVKAGMDRARRQGKQIGRPKVTSRRGFATRSKTILEHVRGGDLSRRKAARELGIGYASLKRLLDSGYGTDDPAGKAE